MLYNSLYIIGIPIGNIYDFSQRAIFILKNVDIIATEDARKTGILLKHLNIRNKTLLSINSYNEISISKNILNYFKKNYSIAFISDAGTPLINDPGFFLVELAKKNNIKIIPIPGISSIITALSISPVKFENFFFNGFLPKVYIQKISYLKKILNDYKTILIFETANRLLETLHIINHIAQFKKKIFIFKDLTKKFEAYSNFDLIFLSNFINKNENKNSGEFILLISEKKITHKFFLKKFDNKKYIEKLSINNIYKNLF